MREDGRGEQYSPLVAFIFIFNLVVGTGVLALPSILSKGGWLLGAIFLLLVSFLSYISLTFVVESMATANAILSLQRELLASGDSRIFQIAKRTELGQMAGLFFNQWGRVFFYAALILYLFGDSVIYSTLVARSLAGLVYGQNPPAGAFDAFLCTFVAFSLPFCLYDFQKTKALQMVTLCIRNTALATMIFVAFFKARRPDPSEGTIPLSNFNALTNLFGGAVYSFMCHHSLPGIITPMKDKSHVLRISACAFLAVLVMYMLLFISCGLAFGPNVIDPVTFNFPPQGISILLTTFSMGFVVGAFFSLQSPSSCCIYTFIKPSLVSFTCTDYGFIGDALVLFPVFTLSSSFPMLSITMRNNLDSLLLLMFPKVQASSVAAKELGEAESLRNTSVNSLAIRNRRIRLTLLAVLPPTICSLIAEHSHISVDELVGLTGAFAGCVVMFIVPASLVYCGRKNFARVIDDFMDRASDQSTKEPPVNIHASPFSGNIWVFVLLGWSGIAILFNVYEKLSS